MKIVKFNRSYLVEDLGVPFNPDPEKVYIAREEISRKNRNTLISRVVFTLEHSNEWYQVEYAFPITGSQDLEPWKGLDEVTAVIVEPREVTRTLYLLVR